MLQKARELVRSINVTADLIEVALGSEHDPSAVGAANKAETPSWDRLMGINSFSIERALQVGRRGIVSLGRAARHSCTESGAQAWAAHRAPGITTHPPSRPPTCRTFCCGCALCHACLRVLLPLVSCGACAVPRCC